MVRAPPDAASPRSCGQCERETGRQRRGTWQLRSQIPSCPRQALRRRSTIPVEPILPLAPVDSRPTSHLAHCSPRGTPLDRDLARLAATDGQGISSCRSPTVFRPMRAPDRQTAPSALACPFADPFMSEQSPATPPRIPFKLILPLAPVDSGTTRHLAHCSPRGTPLEPGLCEAGSNRWSGHLLMLPPGRSSGQCERQTGRQLPAPWQGHSQIRSCPSQALRQRSIILHAPTHRHRRRRPHCRSPPRLFAKSPLILPGARTPVGNAAALTPGPRTPEVRRPHTGDSRCNTNHAQITVPT